MPKKLHSLQIGKHFLSPQKLFINYRKSVMPEGGWTHEEFLGANGMMLVRDLQAVQNAAKIKGTRLLTIPLTRVMRLQIERVLSLMESKMNRSFPGYRSWTNSKQILPRAMNITLSNNQHEDLWAAAIEEAFAQEGTTVLATVRGPLQSVADDVLDKTTTLLTATSPNVGTRRTLQLGINEIAQDVTNINETTRRSLARIINKAIEEGEHPFAVMEIVRKKLPQIATNRVPTIVRTEMGRAVDRAAVLSMKEGGQVTHVSVFGCQHIEKGSPTFNGVPTCNIKNVPIEFSMGLRFHPNHTGAIVASGFKRNDGSRPAIPLRRGSENGTWEDRGRPVPAISNEPPPKPPEPPAPTAPVTPKPPKPPKPAPVSVETPKPLPPKPLPKPKPMPTPAVAPVTVAPPVETMPIIPVMPPPLPVIALPKPVTPLGIQKPTQLVEWSENSQSHRDALLNGVEFSEPTNGYWNDAPKVDLGETAMIVPDGKSKAAGLVMVEDDGRVWIVEPKEGVYDNTFPEATVSQNLSVQKSALKSAFIGAGLEAEITGLLGDFAGADSVSRFYTARRTGGSPWLHSDKNQSVRLSPVAVLEALLNAPRDKEILEALKTKLSQID